MRGEIVFDRQLEAIFETITDVIIIFDAQGNIVAHNFRAPDRLFSPSYNTLSLIERWQKLGLLDEQGQPLSLDNFPPYRILQGETFTGAKSLDVLLPLPDGKLRYFNVGGAPIRDASGNITGAVMVCRDVTERRLLEQQKQELARDAQARASRLETIIDSLVDAVFIYDAQGNILQMNKAARTLLGFSDEKPYASLPVGRRLSLLELRDPRGNPISQEHNGVARLLRGEVLTDSNGIDILMRTLDGREIYANVGGAPLRDSEGNIIGAVGVARDVTERYRLEQRVQTLAREAQARAAHLETIIESMVDGVFIYDEQGRLLQMNQAGRKLLGISDEMQYASLTDEQRSELLQVRDECGTPLPKEQWGLERLLRGEALTGSNRLDILLQTLDGRDIYVNISGAPLRDGAGNIVGAVAVIHDVTERRQLEQQIRILAQEAQTRATWLEAIIDSMAEGVIIYDLDRKIQLMNATLRKAMGIENLDAYNARRFTERARLYEFRDAYGQKFPKDSLSIDLALQQGKITQREVEVIRPDGHRKTLFVSTSPVCNKPGEIIGAVILTQDITERKSIERQKDEFFSIVSHELRTPITAIQGFAEILEMTMEQGESLDNPRSVRAMREILQQSQRLTRLIEEMLEISRIEGQRVLLHPAPHNLLDILYEVIESQQLINKRYALRLTLDGIAPDEGLIGYVDRDRIEQVLNNLVENAAKYSPAGSEIEIGLRYTPSKANEVLIWVKDQGIGIVPDELPRIFDRYHRARNLDHSISGFGIGLYLVHEFVTRHSGKVWVESAEGAGSTFFVSLPLKPPEQSG
ncbi:MAG TPA: PAS domain S-box protein [Ktedonobacteraceae bacterium]|jgi:PAS domain S-box-containing protein|nr:PAS domain S-box protein [Ktedonobacteraceae bacterium]